MAETANLHPWIAPKTVHFPDDSEELLDSERPPEGPQTAVYFPNLGGSMRLENYAAWLMLVTVVWASAPGWGQRTGSNWPSPPAAAERMPPVPAGRKSNVEKLQRAAEQHKMQAQKDAERLSQLVDQLKEELANSPAGTLSVSAIKKSKDVEKLAKQVRKEVGE